MTTLNISPDMMAWAAQKLGKTVLTLAEEMAPPSRVERFASGSLSASQAAQLSAKAGIPFGYLFLQTPPEDRSPTIPDLRQTVDPEPLDRTFFDLLDDIETKRTWFAQHLRENDVQGPDFVGRFVGGNPTAAAVAADIAQTIGVSPEIRAQCKTPGAFYDLLANRFEEAGVLVFRSGVARGNSHRPLPATQFRGFAICDPLVPVVFVNSRDAEAAWVFTLIHEAAHIWLGLSGVSDFSASVSRNPKGLEVLCNRIAAEFLVPNDEFLWLWKKDETGAPIETLARHFLVSRLVVARRAMDAGFIDKARYDAVLGEAGAKRNSNGGNPYATIPIRSSRRFTDAVLNSAMVGETLLREAAQLLNVRPNTVVELHRRNTQKNTAGDASD